MDDPFAGASAVRRALYAGGGDALDEVMAGGPELDLYDAAALGEAGRIRSLVADDPEAVSEFAPEGFTALHLAAFFGQAAAVEALLEAGADVAAVASNTAIGPVQALHSAAASGSVAVCGLLLDAGADANARQGGGFTPLHEAALTGNDALVTLLLRHGADRSPRADSGRTAAELAAEGGHDEIAARLA